MGNARDNDDGQRLYSGSRLDTNAERVPVRRWPVNSPAIPLRDLVEIDPGFQRVIAILACGVARHVATHRDGDDVY